MFILHHLRTASILRLVFIVFISIMPMFTPTASAAIGHNTKVYMATANFVAAGYGLDTTSSRGSDVPLSTAEVDYICSMQRVLPQSADMSLIEWLGVTMAEISGRDTKQIMPALKDPAFCAARVLHTSINKADRIVHLNSKNIVVSTNPVWNACVSGVPVSLALIRSNQDTFAHRQGSLRTLFAKTCRDYHRGDISMWQHPDFPGLEVQLDAKGRLLGGLPTGFIVKKDVKKSVVKN